jgi:uncharacterized protein (TIGR03437 family)
VLDGAAGSTSTTPIQVSVMGPDGPVPGISVMLQAGANGPNVSCVTQSGQGSQPGAVFTNAAGTAICTPVFGGTIGIGTYTVVVGGSFATFGPANLTVTTGPPALIKYLSGSNQNVNPGAQAPVPLLAVVTDLAGNPVAGAAVTWAVTAGSATLTNEVLISPSNGYVSANVTPTAGPVQVTVALAGLSSPPCTFTVNVIETITALQIVAGNNQQTTEGAAFPNPLIVQVNDNSTPVPGVTVTFAVTSGTATISAASVVSNADGQAQVTATAGIVSQLVVITASVTYAANTYNQFFNLTVEPPSPGAIPVSAFMDVYRAGGYSDGSDGVTPAVYSFPAASGQIVTFPSIAGSWTCHVGVASYGPDGTTSAPCNTPGTAQNIDNPIGPFSGYDTTDFVGALTGVFLADSLPASAPPPLRFYVSDSSQGGIQTNFRTLSPQIGQVFFIGDGLTGTGTGDVQVFVVPPTATHLYLGYSDSCGGTVPSCFFDNGGAILVQAAIATQSAPTIASLAPTSASAGGPAFTLTVNGSAFLQCAAGPCLGVNWQPANGAPTFISAQANAAGTQLTAAIPTALMSAVGTVNVSVQAAGGMSNSLPFAVGNPVPTIASLSPASAASGGPAFTLTVNGFGFVQCTAAPAPCLGVNWQPSGGASTFISGQANAAGTQLTATIPAALIATAGTASLTVQASGGTSNSASFTIAGVVPCCNPTGAGHLLFPNVGLNALQEFDAAGRAVVNTIPLPAPFTYSGSVVETVRIRHSDGGILTNAGANGTNAVVALSSSGQFVAAEQVSGGPVQQLAFDPLDSTQSTVLAGSPSSADIIAVDPYSGAESTRISQQGANFTGLAIDSQGRVYAGNSATGQIFRHLPNGTQGSLFADVQQATGSSEIDALAIDSSGNVYAAQSSSNRIAVFSNKGSFLNLFKDPGFNQNASVYFNPADGLLYAGNLADDALTILTTAGTPVAVVHMGGRTVGVPDVVPAAPTPTQGLMQLTLTGLTFQAPQGGSAPPPQSFAVVNNTLATFSFTTSVTTTSGGLWLTVSGGSGSVSAGQVGAAITVGVNPSGLAPGDYYGTVEIDAAGVANSPQFVTVVLNILPATANPGASVSPTGMIFTAVVNGANPASQPVAVSDVLSRSTSFTATGTTTTSPSWFTVTPSQGTIQPGQTMNIQVQPNVTNLPPGVYTGTLTLQFPQDNVIRQITLLLVVATNATEIAQGKYPPRQAIIPCQPTQLLMVFTQLGAGFSQYASWPTTLETFVVDDCGVPMVSGSVTVTFSDEEAALPLISQNDGTWSQTWSPSGAASSLTLTATAVEGALQGSTQIGGVVQANPDIPVLNAGGIVSAASFLPSAIPSPGEIVSIFGVNLADGPEADTQFPLPTEMQNAFILIGSEKIPLLYVSATQINAVVPYDLVGGTAYQAIARHGNRLSAPQRIAMAAADPAVFTPSGNGQGQGYIYIEPGQILAGSSTPATAGDVLTMFCTGLGSVTQPVTAGSAAPSNPLAYTANTVSVTIGGQPATVPFAGLAPGYAGLYQINAKVPSGVPTGDQIPVVITVDGINSPPVTIAVK